MSQKDRTYNYTIRSAKSRLRYRNYRRKHRRELNTLEDVVTVDAVSVPISAVAESPQSQNGTPTGGQVRVSYDERLPCLPQSWECDDPEKAAIANGMQPILQTNTVVQPVPYGTKIRTQNHGGKGGPSQGNISKMRPISLESSSDAAFIQASLTGVDDSSASSGNWGAASNMSLPGGMGTAASTPPVETVPSEAEDETLLVIIGGARYATANWMLSQVPSAIRSSRTVLKYEQTANPDTIISEINAATYTKLELTVFSGGGVNAFKLLEKGIKPDFLGLIDPAIPDGYAVSGHPSHQNMPSGANTVLFFSHQNWGTEGQLGRYRDSLVAIKPILAAKGYNVNEEKINHREFPETFYKRYMK